MSLEEIASALGTQLWSARHWTLQVAWLLKLYSEPLFPFHTGCENFPFYYPKEHLRGWFPQDLFSWELTLRWELEISSLPLSKFHGTLWHPLRATVTPILQNKESFESKMNSEIIIYIHIGIYIWKIPDAYWVFFYMPEVEAWSMLHMW
jgi:hypothetical protein